MLKYVSDLSNSVAGILSGTNLNNVTNLYGAYGRAARVMANRIDVPESSARYNLFLYDGVYDYAAPDNIFGGAVNDLRPQGVTRQPWDYDYKQDISLFDRTKAFVPNGYALTFEYALGVGVMRVATPKVTPKVLLDPMNATTGWTAAGTASSLTTDEGIFYQTPASLRFLQSTGVGTLTKTLTNSLDLENYEDLGVAFLALMIPPGTDPTTLTSLSLKLGSDSGNYNEVTVTEGFLGAWTAGNFLLVAFDFAAATQTGTPDWSALDYVQISATSSGNIVNLRMGYLFIALGAANELLYQTSAIFLEDGEQVEDIVDDQTQIVLNPASYVIYEHECAKAIALQMSGGVYTSEIKGIDAILDGTGGRNIGLYAQYESDNPSQELRTVGSYYEAGQG